MRVTTFIETLQADLPLTLAMPDDPVGLQVAAEDREIEGVAVAYEVDERIVELAHEAGAGLVIAFHPLIYPSLKRVGFGSRVERTVVKLIDRRIALYIVHTAFDAHPRGTSILLGERLGLRGLRPLVPDARVPGAGMGAIGELEEAITLEELAGRLRDACLAPAIRVSSGWSRPLSDRVKRIAILGGSGMSFYDQAIAAGADAFITADVRYHGFHAANDRIPVLDPGHAESEIFVTTGLANLVRSSIERNGLSLRVTPILESTNPVHYVVYQ